MPSLNIKDYIIAGLLVVIVGLGFVTAYDKTQLNIKTDIIEQSNALAEVQKIKIALLKKHSKQTEEYLNEKHNVQLNILNNTVDRLLNSREESLLPAIPAGTPDTSGICFQREDLNAAISGYRNGVQDLVRKGSEAVIGLDIAREWVEKEISIYGDE